MLMMELGQGEGFICVYGGGGCGGERLERRHIHVGDSKVVILLAGHANRAPPLARVAVLWRASGK